MCVSVIFSFEETLHVLQAKIASKIMQKYLTTGQTCTFKELVCVLCIIFLSDYS